MKFPLFKNTLLLAVGLFMAAISQAQSFLPSHSYIIRQVAAGTFQQKSGTTIPVDSQCITTTEAKAWLSLDETPLPADRRMPWYSELHPLAYTEGCATTDVVMYSLTQNAAYSSCGSMIYTSFNTAMTAFVRTPLTTAYWIGNSTDHSDQCSYTPATTRTAAAGALAKSLAVSAVRTGDSTAGMNGTQSRAVVAEATHDGPLNRCGIWGNGGYDPGGIWEHFNFHVNVPVAKTYYVGLGADNDFRLKVDGVPLVDYGTTNDGENFKIWHIFPVPLTAGNHTISFEAYNVAGGVGAFGAQLYNNTITEIQNATSDASLNILFDSKSMIGKKICAMPN